MTLGIEVQKLADERRLYSARGGKVPCYVELGNETGFPHEGVIDFVNNHVDPATGTMRIRGVLKNRSGKLVPGLYARMKVPGSGRYRALLVPDAAVGNDQSQRNVLVVDKDNKVGIRPVKLGALFGRLRSIVSASRRRPDSDQWPDARPDPRPVTPTEVPSRLMRKGFPIQGRPMAVGCRGRVERPKIGRQPDRVAGTFRRHAAGG